jgi:hypothetical protein
MLLMRMLQWIRRTPIDVWLGLMLMLLLLLLLLRYFIWAQ